MLVRLVRPWMHYETGQEYEFFSNIADVLIMRGICEKVETKNDQKPHQQQLHKQDKARK